MKADVVFSLAKTAVSEVASAHLSGSGTASTDTICATDGRTPAIAWPVMIACMYSGLPKLAAKANAPFWQSPVAQDVQNTMINVNIRYPIDETFRKYEVETASRQKTMIFKIREEMIRLGYEAFDWMFDRITIATRFVTVPTEVMADWK